MSEAVEALDFVLLPSTTASSYLNQLALQSSAAVVIKLALHWKIPRACLIPLAPKSSAVVFASRTLLWASSEEARMANDVGLHMAVHFPARFDFWMEEKWLPKEGIVQQPPLVTGSFLAVRRRVLRNTDRVRATA